MWIIWSEINGALKRLSEMWIVSDEGTHTHKYAQIKEFAVLAWLQQCIRNKVSLISEAHVQYTTTFFFFWFSLLSRSENRKPQSTHVEQNTWITFSRLSIIEGHRGFTLCINCMCSAYFFFFVVRHYNVLNKFWVETFVIWLLLCRFRGNF